MWEREKDEWKLYQSGGKTRSTSNSLLERHTDYSLAAQSQNLALSSTVFTCPNKTRKEIITDPTEIHRIIREYYG